MRADPSAKPIAREFWILVHDILRDLPSAHESNPEITIQRAIDAASEAYELLTGEKITEWFAE